MSAPKHTPGPWEARWSVQRWAGGRELNTCVIGTPKDARGATHLVTRMDGPTSGDLAVDKANAEFIVRACNSHDALIEALEGLANRVDPGVKSRDFGIDSLVNALSAARAAIAKARGEP